MEEKKRKIVEITFEDRKTKTRFVIKDRDRDKCRRQLENNENSEKKVIIQERNIKEHEVQWDVLNYF